MARFVSDRPPPSGQDEPFHPVAGQLFRTAFLVLTVGIEGVATIICLRRSQRDVSKTLGRCGLEA